MNRRPDLRSRLPLPVLVALLGLSPAVSGCDDASPKAEPVAAVPPPRPAAEAAPSAGKAAAPAEVTPEPPPEPPPEPVLPAEPYQVLFLGGSVMATGFGARLEEFLDAHPHVKTRRRGKSASGLSRPDFFDWMWEGRRQVELRGPDMVVVLMGGNDGQDLQNQTGKGTRVHWDTDEWKERYRERVGAFLAAIHGPDRKIVWLELPRTNTHNYEGKLAVIRAAQRDAVEAFGPDAIYLETSSFLEAADGSLMKTARVGRRDQPTDLRADDGVHFTLAGSEFLAAAVGPRLIELLGLPPREDLEKKAPEAVETDTDGAPGGAAEVGE